MTISPRPLVVALAYDGLCTFEFGVAVEIFGLPRPELGDKWYRFAVASADSGPLRATGGVQMLVDGGLELLAQADIIVIPGWRDSEAPVPDALCAALRAAWERGCRLLSICSGVFVLAATGLLDNHKATTHWRYTDKLRERHPDIQVLDDVLYFDAGQLLTSAGSAAGIDLCLYVVREDYGLDVANSVARRLVVQPHRDGAQPQQIERPVARLRESQTLGKIFEFLQQNLTLSHTTASLAKRASMSPRTFLRRFEECSGMTPSRWILQERLTRARDYLENSPLSIDNIAEQTGFGSAAVFRHHFRLASGMTPSQYRNKKNRRITSGKCLHG